MNPIFFAKQSDFRKWLQKNYKKEKELLVGYYKVGSGKPSLTWPQSVDEALCFGWIDGVRRSIDAEAYCIRFTPRKPGSIWSLINIKKVEELSKQGLMKPEGLAAFELRKDHSSKIYTYENETVPLSEDFEKQFKANKKSWTYFNAQALSYKKVAYAWVMRAKQEATRLNRLLTLIADSEAGKKLWDKWASKK